MRRQEHLTIEELKGRAIRFFDRYGRDLEQIRQILEIRLNQLALAYTIDYNLPPEAIVVSTRVKTLKSFLEKAENLKWPQFYYPTEIVNDLIGARVTCWFIDDCEGITKLICNSRHLVVDKEEIADYIQNPKKSGYRAIHILASVGYDSVQRENGKIVISNKYMKCEIQVRTKLQDAWADVTHGFHYKAKKSGVDNRVYEKILCEVSDRLANEDKSILTVRDAYQNLAEDKLKNKTREGFRNG